MRFSVHQVSRQGGRANNEDRMGYSYTRQCGLFLLADGMGGHPEGEVASRLALASVAAQFQRLAQPRLEDPARFLHDAFIGAHQELLRYASGKSLPDTPRTTLVVCVLQEGQAWWAHCGDSRLYALREAHLVTRTRDHSYHEIEGSFAGLLPEGAVVSRSALYTCLGSPITPMVDTAGPMALQPGDRLLLCSDGLWAPLPDEEIVRVMTGTPLARAVPEAVELALRRAGPRSDNVTALGVEWEGDAEPVQTPAAPAAGALVSDTDMGTREGGAPPADNAPGQAGRPASAEPGPDEGGLELPAPLRKINDTILRAVRRKPQENPR
ncbi:MAG: PP2C family protein-serine/threonine phosphatase [Rubrivivax sp.]